MSLGPNGEVVEMLRLPREFEAQQPSGTHLERRPAWATAHGYCSLV